MDGDRGDSSEFGEKRNTDYGFPPHYNWAENNKISAFRGNHFYFLTIIYLWEKNLISQPCFLPNIFITRYFGNKKLKKLTAQAET